ncbi:MAG: hypothetical protein HY843_02820 [Bdellovibrio sp.]|nr:hypothetical protein [Bdellovibrio sp.]
MSKNMNYLGVACLFLSLCYLQAFTFADDKEVSVRDQEVIDHLRQVEKRVIDNHERKKAGNRFVLSFEAKIIKPLDDAMAVLKDPNRTQEHKDRIQFLLQRPIGHLKYISGELELLANSKKEGDIKKTAKRLLSNCNRYNNIFKKYIARFEGKEEELKARLIVF